MCSEKRIQFCNFSSVFQTLLNFNFIDAVYTFEILFFRKFSPKSRCGLYVNAGYTPLSTVSRKCFQKTLNYRSNFINYRDSYLAISWQKYATIQIRSKNHFSHIKKLPFVEKSSFRERKVPFAVLTNPARRI